ncbi:MAG: TCR/Tet family MFS transporter [Alphaproteobacteria bacterium]|nr:TCR/Tet family MFS transporter [Alphaproteobacteria bacterium]
MTEERTSRHALVFIFITIFVDVIGLGIVIPVAPKLISELAHVALSDAARYGGLLMFVYAGMTFLFAPAIGNLSDRFGRRPVLIASLLAIGVDYAITGFAPTISWLFVARALSGMAGASYTTAYAYIADVTPPEKRAASFGMIGAAFGLGFIVGPAIGGLLGQYGVRVPFYASAVIAFANAAYGYFILGESLTRERRRKFEIWRANPLGALVALRRFPFVLGLCGVIILMRLAHDANPATWTYYTMLKFHWTTADVGYSLMAIGATTTVVYAWLTRVLIPLIGEVRAVYIGLAAGAAGFAGFAFSAHGWQMYAWMPMFALIGLIMPAMNAIMSKSVGASEQGELQGAITSVGSLTSIVAPLAMSYLFAYFTSVRAPAYFPGAAFLAASICLVLAGVAFAFVKPEPVNEPLAAAAEQET